MDKGPYRFSVDVMSQRAIAQGTRYTNHRDFQLDDRPSCTFLPLSFANDLKNLKKPLVLPS